MTERSSRPATLEDLKALLRALNDQSVDYLLIGGYALYIHGYQRATVDIDILLPATRETGERVKQALLALPDQAARDIDPAWFEDGENIRVADAFVVDLMMRAGGETFETLRPFAQTIEIDGILVHTVNLEGLLRTKNTLRDKDRVDRVVLERALTELRRKPK